MRFTAIAFLSLQVVWGCGTDTESERTTGTAAGKKGGESSAEAAPAGSSAEPSDDPAVEGEGSTGEGPAGEGPAGEGSARIEAEGNLTPKQRKLLLHPDVFNPTFYKNQYSDLKNKTIKQLEEHWLGPGMKAKRQASVVFNLKEYLENYPHLQAKFGPGKEAMAVLNFMNHGRRRNLLGTYGIKPEVWLRALTTERLRQSPAAPDADDWHESFTAPNGEEVSVVVRAPRTSSQSNRIRVLVGDPNDGDGVFEAFRQAIAEAKNSPSAVITVDRGRYRISGKNKAHLDFSGLTDVVFDANGSEFVLLNPLKRGVLVENSQRITLKNFSLDYEFRPSFRGVIEKRGGQKVLRNISGASFDPVEIKSVTTFDHDRHRWMTGNRHHEIFIQKNNPLRKVATNVYSHPYASNLPDSGQILFLKLRTQYKSTVIVQGTSTEDINLEDIVVLTSPKIAFQGLGSRGLRIVRSGVRRNADIERDVSILGTGIRVSGMQGDIIAEDNFFFDQGDDGVNIHGLGLIIESFSAGQRLLTLKDKNSSSVQGNTNTPTRFDMIEEGDVVGVMSYNNSVIGIARIEKLQRQSREVVVLQLEEIYQDSPLDGLFDHLHKGAFLENLSKASSRYVFRNNRFGNHRAVSMKLRAPNGLVEDSSIEDVSRTAVNVSASHGTFHEGPGGSNVLVRNNSIAKTQANGARALPGGALTIYSDDRGMSGNYPLIQMVVAEGNRIHKSQGMAIQVATTRHVKLLDNEIGDTNLQKFSYPRNGARFTPEGGVMILRSYDVEIAGNRRLPQTSGDDLVIDAATTHKVSSQGSL